MPLNLTGVIDLVKVAPFKEYQVSNSTAVMFLEKGSKTAYPVNYEEWTPLPKQSAKSGDRLSEVRKKVSVRESQSHSGRGDRDPMRGDGVRGSPGTRSNKPPSFCRSESRNIGAVRVWNRLELRESWSSKDRCGLARTVS